MPELPDVEVFRRYLESTALHQEIEKVSVESDDILEGVSSRGLQMRLKGCSFEFADRHGKYLFVDAGRADLLVMHFGMTGYLKYFKGDGEIPPHTRVLFLFRNGYRLSYVSVRKLGMVGMTPGMEDFLEERGLGGDALAISLGEFRSLADGRRGAVKCWLMDQSAMAGIGNVYSDEALFHAGIDPKRKVKDLDRKDLSRLFRKMRHVLSTAVERKADPDDFPQSFLVPRRAEKAKCPRCGGGMCRVRACGRASFCCPKCQK